ncbi:hypothetical protein J6590_044891 [Homalodisca vitripennis]|nr:hypothetical protein J6590_044891 [Homalodisca vitripennis]
MANRTQVLDDFDWEVLVHPPYSPDLAPSDCHLSPAMKTFLATQCFDSDTEYHADVNTFATERRTCASLGLRLGLARLT